jgi:hypothetical protein
MTKDGLIPTKTRGGECPKGWSQSNDDLLLLYVRKVPEIAAAAELNNKLFVNIVSGTDDDNGDCDDNKQEDDDCFFSRNFLKLKSINFWHEKLLVRKLIFWKFFSSKSFL